MIRYDMRGAPARIVTILLRLAQWQCARTAWERLFA